MHFTHISMGTDFAITDAKLPYVAQKI